MRNSDVDMAHQEDIPKQELRCTKLKWKITKKEFSN